MSGVRFQRGNHVVSSLDRALTFYRDVLGFTIQAISDPGQKDEGGAFGHFIPRREPWNEGLVAVARGLGFCGQRFPDRRRGRGWQAGRVGCGLSDFTSGRPFGAALKKRRETGAFD